MYICYFFLDVEYRCFSAREAHGWAEGLKLARTERTELYQTGHNPHLRSRPPFWRAFLAIPKLASAQVASPPKRVIVAVTPRPAKQRNMHKFRHLASAVLFSNFVLGLHVIGRTVSVPTPRRTFDCVHHLHTHISWLPLRWLCRRRDSEMKRVQSLLAYHGNSPLRLCVRWIRLELSSAQTQLSRDNLDLTAVIIYSGAFHKVRMSFVGNLAHSRSPNNRPLSNVNCISWI
jgi:hypothetical protein